MCNDTIESCVVQIEYCGDRYIILAVYRPHTDSIENFNKTLYDMLHTDVLRGKAVILAGDMNVDLLKQNLPHISAFVDIMQSTTFLPAITKATRFPPAGSSVAPSLLDHIWINMLCTFKGGIISIDNTDHCPAFVKIPIVSAKNHSIKLSFRIHQPNLIENFKREIEILVNNINFSGNVSTDTANLLDGLNAVYVKCFPIKVKHISLKRLRKPWISTGILTSIKTKSRYFKLFKLGMIDEVTNRRYRNCLNSVIRSAKKNYYIKHSILARIILKRPGVYQSSFCQKSLKLAG